jgi:Xaa-Pro aminopeptidase
VGADHPFPGDPSTLPWPATHDTEPGGSYASSMSQPAMRPSGDRSHRVVTPRGPFSAQDFAARMERAARSAADAGLAGALVTPGPDLLYLTGYAPVAVTERITMLVLPVEKDPTMIVPRLERPDAENAPAAPRLRLVDWTDGSDPYEATARLLSGAGRYAVSDSAWAMHLLGLQEHLPDSRYVSMTAALPMLRAIKDDDEIQRLSGAAEAADSAYYDILTVRFAGRTEAEVAADLAELLRTYGHTQVDFTVVGSGPNGANPHHEIGDRVIADGDMIVLDFGGLKDGYGSDTTRTVHVGEPTQEEQRVHDIVRQAQQAGFEAVRPGIECQEVDRVPRRLITEAGYGEYFIHRTGHGIGLTTHEPPYLVEGETQVVQPGMCFSIEPGIYLPGRFGVRIEDIVTVTADGGRRLNRTPREMQIVA